MTMATTVTNKTRKALSIPLSHGKKLFLSPGKSGEIASNDLETAPVKALVESGAIEVVNARGFAGSGSTSSRGRASEGHSSGGGPRRSGDR